MLQFDKSDSAQVYGNGVWSANGPLSRRDCSCRRKRNLVLPDSR